MLNIRQVLKDCYPNGKTVHYHYVSTEHYAVKMQQNVNGWQLLLTKSTLAQPFQKNLQLELCEPYKANAEMYVAERDSVEVAVLVIEHIAWNNTLLIHDLYVTEAYKRQGIGRALLNFAKERASQLGARAVVLETQTTNVPAIEFYLQNNFTLIGLNTMSYSNEDVANGEVRIEMGYIVGG